MNRHENESAEAEERHARAIGVCIDSKLCAIDENINFIEEFLDYKKYSHS